MNERIGKLAIVVRSDGWIEDVVLLARESEQRSAAAATLTIILPLIETFQGQLLEQLRARQGDITQ